MCLAGHAASFLPPSAAADEKKPAAKKTTYDDHVKNILREKCFACHNPDKRSGDLDMTNYTNLMQGGGSGEVIEPGDASASYLYMLATHEEDPTMPPESPKIPDAMLETIRAWIDGGALENAGSKSHAAAKPKLAMAPITTADQRPAVVPMPGRVALEPIPRCRRPTSVSALATSPWAPLVAVAGQKQVLLYHAETNELLGVLPFPEGAVYVLKFSRNGSLLLAGGGRGAASGRVVVWDVRTGDRVIEIGDELDVVLAADISADQTLVALGGPQRVVRVYSTEDGKIQHEIRKHTDWIDALAFSPDGVLLATGDRAGGLLLWEAYTGRAYADLRGHGAAVTSLAWRADSNVLASASEDGTVRLWEMEQGRQVRKWNAHAGGALAVRFARSGQLVSCGRDRVAKLWDQNGKALRSFEPFADVALEIAFSDETSRVVAGDWSGVVRVFAAADGSPLATLDSNPPQLARRLEAATADLAAAEKQLAAAETAAQAARQQIDQNTPKAAAAAKTAASAKGAAEVAAAEVAKAEAEVDRWTGEIAFVQRITDLVAQRAAARAKLAEVSAHQQETAAAAQTAQAALDQASAKLAAAQQAAAAAAGQADKGQDTVDETEALAKKRDVANQLASQLASQTDAVRKKAEAAKKTLEEASRAVAEADALVHRLEAEITAARGLSGPAKESQAGL